MMPPVDMRTLIDQLSAAQNLLQNTEQFHPALHTANRRLSHIAQVLQRPFRIAIIGKSNSGKTSIANLIAGEATLPVLPVANTRVPTLLHYAPTPRVEALYQDGQRIALSSHDGELSRNILRLEVGLPSEQLRTIEVLDFPGSANPLFHADAAMIPRNGADAAVWATVATQAWRETERQAWSKLPPRLRRRGILAVTHRDLIKSEDDFLKLKARLEPVKHAHFTALCFVAAAWKHEPASRRASADVLRAEVEHLLQKVTKERGKQAARLASRVASRALASLESLVEA